MAPGPEDVTLLRDGELRQGFWDAQTFAFRVLLGPYGPFPRVTTAFEVVAPHVPLLKPLHVLRLFFGSFGIASRLEYLKLLFRNCRIILYNLGVGFLLSMILAFTLTFQAANMSLNLLMVRLFIFFIVGSFSGSVYWISSRPGNKNIWCNRVRRECFIFGLFFSFSSLMVAHAHTL